MVKQLMLFAQQGSGERISVQPQGLIVEIVDMCRGTFDRKIDLELVPRGDLPQISGDATLLRHVFLGLLVNARDAVEAVAQPDERQHPETQLGRYIRLDVRDNGIGMNAEARQRLFEPIFLPRRWDRARGWVCRRLKPWCGSTAAGLPARERGRARHIVFCVFARLRGSGRARPRRISCLAAGATGRR